VFVGPSLKEQISDCLPIAHDLISDCSYDITGGGFLYQ